MSGHTTREMADALNKILAEHPEMADRQVWLNVRTDEVESTIDSVWYDEHHGIVCMATQDTFDDDEPDVDDDFPEYLEYDDWKYDRGDTL